MQKGPLRLAFLLGLLLSMSSPMEGAALSNASLQGSYFFAYQKIDPTIPFGPLFTTATGTLTFNGAGSTSFQGFINRQGTVQFISGSGTYSLNANGSLQVSLPGIPTTLLGIVSFDLNVLATTSLGTGNLQSQEILLATRFPSTQVSEAFLNGKYFLAERTITAAGTTPQFENAQGTITFNGQGGYSLTLSRNRAGSTTTVNASGSYQVTAGGTILLNNLPDRSDAVQVGFTPGGSFGAGATVAANSRTTHDFFMLSKADSSGLGNAGLNGTYQTIVATANVNAGFATAVGLVDYMGDGNGFYQFSVNEMGIGQGKTGGTTFSVENDAKMQLQFNNLSSSPKPFQGGLGTLGYSLLGASVNDASLYNFLVAVRTPSQPAAATNAASFSGSTALSPGALFSIFGRNLSRQRIQASFVPCPGSGEPRCLPKLLGGATVKVGGIEAPLVFVSPFQINAQVPYELQPGGTSITIVLDGVESGPLAATVTAAGPGLFTLSQDGQGKGIFQHGANFSPVTESNPARPGETIIIYSTGLGAVMPAVASGLAAPANPPAQANLSVSVQIGGKNSNVSFAGLSPNFVGLYQINAIVPSDIPAAQNLPVVVTAGGVQSNTVSIPVAP